MSQEQLPIGSDYKRLLTSVFYFMRKSGFGEKEVRDVCRKAIAQTRDVENSSASSSPTLPAAALILDAWHRNRRYLDGTSPRAIPLFGPRPSVEALARSHGRHDDPIDFVRHLKDLGLIVRCSRNRYRPSDRFALVSDMDPMIHQYVARSSATLLDTMKHNTSRSGHGSRLLERFAEVPDLPKNKAAEFRRFTQLQGRVFLLTLNDWLESRRQRRTSARGSRTVRAGVHLYAYVDETLKKEPNKRRRLPQPN